MVTKNILTQSLAGLQAGTNRMGSQGKTGKATDFSKTMDDVQKNQSKSNQQSGNSSVKNKTDVAASKDMKQLSDSKRPAADSKDALEVKAEGKETWKAADKEGGDMLEGLEEEAAVLLSGQILTPQLLMEGAGQLEEQISELVTEILGITEEELMDLLEESGMQLLDLLDSGNLKQLVLDANGFEDAISLVTDENAAGQYQQLLEAMETVETEGLGITKEEIIGLMEAPKEEASSAKEELATEGNEEEQVAATAEDSVKIVVEKENSSQPNKDFQKEASQRDSRLEDVGKEPAQDAKPLDLFIQNLASQGTEEIQEAAQRVQTVKEIVNQIVEQIKVAIKPESTSMELQLHPESLGRVNLTVVSKNGLLTASFVAENQLAKEAIESQMQVLKDNLNNQGVKVEAIEVNVSQFGFRQNTESGADAKGQSNQQKKSGGRRINLDYFDEEDVSLSEEDALAAQVLHDNGGTVDFTA